LSRGTRVWARRGGVGRGVAAAGVLFVVIISVVAAYVVSTPSNSISYSIPTGTGGLTFTSSTIKIGYLTELSGDAVSNGYAARIGAELAINQTNAAGGIDGKTIDLVVADARTDPQMAVQGAETLDSQGVLAITGPTDQADAVAVEGYAEAAGVPFVVSTVSSAALTPPGLNWTVDVEPDAVQWGAAMAKYVSQVVPGAKIALMTENAEQQNEMTAGVKWYASTFKNESIVFDQEYANAQFPWATAAEAAKLSGANAVVVSWLSAVGFSQANVLTALISAGFLPSQIFVIDATSQVSDLGTSATGIRGVTLFDGAMAQGYPNASAFAGQLQPFVNGELNSKEYCGVCPTEVSPLYYYSYLGTEMMLNSIRSVLSSGQTLTRADFMSSIKHASIQDAFGNTLSIADSGAAEGNYYVVAVGPLGSAQSTYPLQLVKNIRFAPGVVPAYQLAKTA